MKEETLEELKLRLEKQVKKYGGVILSEDELHRLIHPNEIE